MHVQQDPSGGSSCAVRKSQSGSASKSTSVNGAICVLPTGSPRTTSPLLTGGSPRVGGEVHPRPQLCHGYGLSQLRQLLFAFFLAGYHPSDARSRVTAIALRTDSRGGSMDQLSVARPGRTAATMSKTRAAVVLLAVGALLLIGSPAQALGWTTVPSPNEVPGDNYLYAADASGASNVWAAGNRPAGLGYDTVAAHWNGTTWTREPTPNGNPGGFNHLYGVATAGGTVWAVGTYVDPSSSINRRKLILQRAGGSWRVSAAPTVAAYEHLAAADATGLADAWAVGSATSDIQSAPLAPLALRWNGSRWVSMTLPATGSTALAGVDARTSSDVWAVGSSRNADGAQPYVARFDGTSWRRVATPTIGAGGELTDVVALSPSTVVAVGRSNGAPLVLRWNGTSWTRETTPGSSNPFVTGAAAGGPNAVWAVGYRFELSAYSNRTLTMLGT